MGDGIHDVYNAEDPRGCQLDTSYGPLREVFGLSAVTISQAPTPTNSNNGPSFS
jgi:hypothetical protein